MRREFGHVRHIRSNGGQWQIEASPDVTLRLKRLFPRADQSRKGYLTVADTPETSRDLEWALERWPMQMSTADHAHLIERAEAHRQTEQAVLRVLAGHHIPTEGMRTPAIEPRDYQLTAADVVLSSGRLLLGDDLGLGKTITSLLVLREADALPALVVCPTHLPHQWQRELQKTFPELRSHILRKGTPYDISAKREMKGHRPDLIICNYAKLAGWAEHLASGEDRIKTVIFDEVQELRIPDSQKYRAAGRVADVATYRMGLTATPVYNYGGEIHSIISILDRDALGDRAEFSREWGYSDGRGNVHIADPAALGTWLRNQGLFLRRTREEVGRELPEVNRVLHAVDVDEKTLDRLGQDAVDLAQLIVEKAGTPKERWRAGGELHLRMRQATGVAKAPYVAAFCRMLLESEEKIVLFGWHHDVYDIWRQQLREFKPVFFTGEESTAQKEASRHAFMEGDSRILVMSLRAGSGLDGLQDVTSVCVFGELDWSPGIHIQAIGRLHRDGIDQPVVAYFLVSEEGSDPVMAEVLDVKTQQAEPIRDPDAAGLQPIAVDTDRIARLAEQVMAKHAKRRKR
jgi:SNF2 family DNA or RNA helicase